MKQDLIAWEKLKGFTFAVRVSILHVKLAEWPFKVRGLDQEHVNCLAKSINDSGWQDDSTLQAFTPHRKVFTCLKSTTTTPGIIKENDSNRLQMAADLEKWATTSPHELPMIISGNHRLACLQQRFQHKCILTPSAIAPKVKVRFYVASTGDYETHAMVYALGNVNNQIASLQYKSTNVQRLFTMREDVEQTMRKYGINLIDEEKIHEYWNDKGRKGDERRKKRMTQFRLSWCAKLGIAEDNGSFVNQTSLVFRWGAEWEMISRLLQMEEKRLMDTSKGTKKKGASVVGELVKLTGMEQSVRLTVMGMVLNDQPPLALKEMKSTALSIEFGNICRWMVLQYTMARYSGVNTWQQLTQKWPAFQNASRMTIHETTFKNNYIRVMSGSDLEGNDATVSDGEEDDGVEEKKKRKKKKEKKESKKSAPTTLFALKSVWSTLTEDEKKKALENIIPRSVTVALDEVTSNAASLGLSVSFVLISTKYIE
jgi:hypothetical protein